MSTDIVDKDLKTLRNARWDKAFKQGDSADHVDDNPRDEVNRKATIVVSCSLSHTAHCLLISLTVDCLLTHFDCRLSISSRQVILVTPCSIGTSTASGTRICSRSCM